LKNLIILFTGILFLCENLKAQTSFDITNQTTGDTLFHIENNGSVGIGTTSPVAELQVERTDGVLFKGTFGSGLIPVEGIGTRLMWYPGKAAFRVGHAAGTHWNDINIGNYSIALGYNTIASANNSTAFGSITIASGVYSTALGVGTRALGLASTTMGINTQAEGAYSTALGASTVAYGDYSTAIGQEIEARGSHTIAIALSDQNGLQVMQDSTLAIMGGKVGIGIVAPTTSLEVADTIYSSVGGFKFPDGSVQLTAAATSTGNTLDQAYDEGGAGSGRIITADAGAFEVSGVDGALFTGTFGSGTIPTETAGSRMMWYPNKSAFRVGTDIYGHWNDVNIGDYSFATGYNTEASGNRSTAMGSDTEAAGTRSTALGDGSQASGTSSTAMGNNTWAGGDNSTALGSYTQATGNSSITMGYSTEASGDYSVAIGQEIEAAGSHTIAIALSDQNGLSITQDSTLAIMGGKVGINEFAPNAELHVGGTKGVLFTGTYGSGTIPVEGAGTRMMWYPTKAAFRSGSVSGAQWNDIEIGAYSFASGYNTIASDISSTAIGADLQATGEGSIVMGSNSTATGNYSISAGYLANSNGYYSRSLGYNTSANAAYSTAIGRNTTASGQAATAMGNYVSALHGGSFIIGDNSTTTSLNSSYIDQFSARFANGYRLYTNDVCTLGVSLGAGGTSWSSISDSTKKENFKTVNGEDVLSKISNFNLTSWNFKGQDPKQCRHYGPMAQDFYAAFGSDGIGTIGNDTTIASADFDGVNLIAIQALEKRTTQLKEKTNEITNLKKEIELLKNENQNLKQHLTDLTSSISELKTVMTNLLQNHKKEIKSSSSTKITNKNQQDQKDIFLVDNLKSINN
jgi:hypothetical protein